MTPECQQCQLSSSARRLRLVAPSHSILHHLQPELHSRTAFLSMLPGTSAGQCRVTKHLGLRVDARPRNSFLCHDTRGCWAASRCKAADAANSSRCCFPLHKTQGCWAASAAQRWRPASTACYRPRPQSRSRSSRCGCRSSAERIGNLHLDIRCTESLAADCMLQPPAMSALSSTNGGDCAW